MSQTGLPAMVTNYERTYTSYGQEATEAANAGAKVSDPMTRGCLTTSCLKADP